ncbi:Anti-sigma-K factor RskA [Sphingomonas guangdongensis]|uniref:Anti-sigma-K factor RskA n=1 Tax=Sphingomonas guangdongensis TaxID=1141890 RepID=A0A285QAX0_9SPHN|nr:anti-sigma factor [Sphingomonas guangdongensis]SOB78589.1 Anti-sigma-K factor RskA [Sphingomonas guangdongensis]
MTDFAGDPSEDDLLAGELALGVLRGDERAAALRRVVAEPAFARAVEDWQLRLAPLLLRIEPAAAPEQLWTGIERSLPDAAAAPATIRRWRIATALSTAVAASLAVLLVARHQPVAPPPPVATVPAPTPMLAQVPTAEGLPIVSALYDASSGRLRVRTANLPSGEHAPELWVIVGDAAPRSLGMVRLNGASEHSLPQALRPALTDGAIIAVTMERPDAPSHAAPTGAVMGTARLTIV